MRHFAALVMIVLCVAVSANANTPLAELEKAARAGTKNTARVPLAEVTDIANADPLGGRYVPNYTKALAATTKSAAQHANLVQTFLFGGSVAPETKMAMGLRIAQIYNSPYLYAHASRWLRATARGTEMLKGWEKDSFTSPEALAIEYAEKLTNDIHGVTDSDFERVRGVYNDSQIIELTMTVSFFNHFVRLIEGLGLPAEEWVLNDAKPVIAATINKTVAPAARVALVSDNEMSQTVTVLENAKQTANQAAAQGLGLGIANSQRAFLRVPALGQAWREFGTQNRATWTIERNIQLQISFAVSMVNGCRYCTLHQVLGLRRLGVDPKKLLSMKKDDSQLTPRELNAVEFARKITKQPNSTTIVDFDRLKKEFGQSGAVEVILQTGNFAFMNRFTDGLRLPSEDEAVKTYQEVYGDGAYRDWKVEKQK